MIPDHDAPSVSVLLPVRDGAATIAQAIDSIRGQSLVDLELIVVDDGSTDDTLMIVEQIAAADSRVRVIRRPPDGLVSALNTAAGAARASAWARMDADDLAAPRRLSVQLARLRRDPTLGAVGCLVRTIGDFPTEGWRRYEQWLNSRRTWKAISRDLFVESPLAHPSVMMRRSAFEAVGGYRSFDGPEDYDLWLRMAGAGWRLAKIGSVLLDWRDHPGRLTRTDPRYRIEAFIRLKAYHLARGPLRDLERPIWIWGAGRYGRRLGRALEVESIVAAAYIDIDPVKIGRTRRGRPVVAADALRGCPSAVVLVAVPVAGARSLIRGRLTRMGWREGQDYWCCA